MTARARIPIADRFWPKVEKRGPEECWLWKASLHRDGYGWIRRVAGGYMALAHRISWELHNGAVPRGLYILHHCDNPPCVNPAHLFLGTQIDNMKDMTAKGRRIRKGGARGEANAGAKVTEDEVRQIREIYGDGNISQEAIGKMFGLAQGPISQIIRRVTWRHVP